MQTAPRLRILNAMADEANITVQINGKTVYRNLLYTDQKWYVDVFADGSPLPIGSNQKLVVLNPEGDTVVKQTIGLSDGRQTMIVTGRTHQRFGNTPAPARAIMLNDEEGQPQDGKNVVRFVHAMPDLDSIDIYFRSTIEGAQPDLRIAFGEKTPYSIITQITGLTVTERGDTTNVIFKIGENFPIEGMFGTVVIRGATDPHGDEPLPSPVVLSDSPLGATFLSITSIFVRFVNGSRDASLSLLPQGNFDTGGPRIEVAGQQAVFCIPPDSASGFWSITHLYHGKANWNFATACPPDTASIEYTYRDELEDLRRYSIIALQTSKIGEQVVWDHMRTLDSMTTPANKAFGRVRFINLSPDADVTVTKADGSQVVLRQKEILYEDYPVGQKTYTSNGRQYTFTVAPDDPKTVWFSAATPSNPLPYRVTQD